MNSIHAEQLLASIVAGHYSDKIIGASLMAGMDETWFTSADHRKLWHVIVELYQQDIALNIFEVHSKSAAMGVKYSSDSFLERLVDSASFLHNWNESIGVLRNCVILKNAESAIVRAGARLKDCLPEDANEAIASIQAEIMGIDVSKQNEEIHPADAAIEQVKEWRDKDISDRDGLHWFIQTIDDLIGPLTDELVYLNALPSVGKTAFALNMVVNSAYRNERVSFVSLESPVSKVGQRLTSIVSKHNANKLKFKVSMPEKYNEAVEKLGEFKKYPSGWTFTARSVEQIYAWSRMEKKRGSRAIVIDNMKHIKTSAHDSTVEQFRELSLRLKELRDMLGMSVIVLHHLNDDLKLSWSRDIERDADIIINLVNADDDIGAETRRIRFIVQKNREGNTGELQILFHKQTQSFE